MERKDSRDDMMFRQAFNENREMLERLAYFSVRDKEAARDIVSSTFLKLWETREKIDMDRFLPYIYISVKNACINYRRDSATHRNVYDNILQREQSAMEFYTKAMESCNPAELYVEDILAICRGRLENYPPLLRLIYIKRVVEGLSYKEIAEALDISVKKVDNSLQFVLKDLRIALADYLPVFILMALATAVRI